MDEFKINEILSITAILVFLGTPFLVYFQLCIPIHMLQLTLLLGIFLIVLTAYFYFKFNKPDSFKSLFIVIIIFFIFYLKEYLDLIFN